MSASVVDCGALRRGLWRRGLSPYRASILAGAEGSYVRDVLRGKVRSPSAVKLQRLAAVLGVVPSDLMIGGDSSVTTGAGALEPQGGASSLPQSRLPIDAVGTPDMVVPAQREIRVHLGGHGDVVIQMVGEEADGWVAIRPEYVDAVIAAMLRVKAEASR